MTRLDVLPSAICTASAPGIGLFRGSMAGLCAPLSTLRRNPRGQLRMTRGRCGSLILHRKRLALSTPCRSPGASPLGPTERTSMRGAATSLTGPKGDIHWHALVFVWLADDRRFIGDVLFFVLFVFVLIIMI